MRVGVTEKQLHPGRSTPEDHNITYEYDNLNRLIYEDANDGNNSGYNINYQYDTVGNRIKRTVTCNGGNLETNYYYDDANDALLKEIVTEPSAAIPYGRRYIYAYATPDGVRYRPAGRRDCIGGFEAFCMGLPSKWLHYAFIAAMVLVPVVFFGPALRYLLRRLKNNKPRDPPRRKGLLRRCVSVLLAYMLLTSPI